MKPKAFREKRFVAVSCSHGHLINKNAAEAVLKFIDGFKPDKVFHLGDFIDADAFRGSAIRNGEGGDIIADLEYGLSFIQDLAPTTVFLGNHEDRLFRILVESKSEMVRYAAGDVVNKIHLMLKALKSDVVPYAGMSNPAGYRILGGTLFTHGYAFGMMAARDHAQMHGRPVVMGHIHKLTAQPSRTPNAPTGYAVGCLCDIPAMQYAKTRMETATWDHGFAYGTYNDDYCTVNLERINKWEPTKYELAK